MAAQSWVLKRQSDLGRLFNKLSSLVGAKIGIVEELA